MCEIIAVSAGPYSKAHQYLSTLARKAAEPMNGWGIGFFRNNQACIETSSGELLDSAPLYDSWQTLTRMIHSQIMISQIRCPLECGRHIPDNRPFSLTFFEHTWLFAHVGQVDRIGTYRTVHSPKIDSTIYPARIFEYLRDQLLSYTGSNPYGSLHKALSYGIRRLCAEYPGRYAFLLANESVLFAFCNFGSFMLMRKPASFGSALLLTSLSESLNRQGWTPIRPNPTGAGKLLTIAGPNILHLGDV